MDMMTMQEKMMKGPKTAEKKQMMKDMSQMKEKMQQMMSKPMDMKCMVIRSRKKMRAKNQKKQNPPRLLRINIKMTSNGMLL